MKKPLTILCAGLLAIVVAACNPKHDADTANRIGSSSEPAVKNNDAATAGTNLTNATVEGGPGTGVSAEPSTTASGSKDKASK